LSFLWAAFPVAPCLLSRTLQVCIHIHAAVLHEPRLAPPGVSGVLTIYCNCYCNCNCYFCRYQAAYRELAKKHPSFRARSETTELIVDISLQVCLLLASQTGLPSHILLRQPSCSPVCTTLLQPLQFALLQPVRFAL